MSNDPKGKGPSWKQPQSGSRPEPQRQRAWQPTGASKPATSGKRGRLLLVAGGAGVLLAVIVALILLLRPPRQPKLVLVGAANSTQLTMPHNAGGAANARAFEAWTQSGRDAAALAAPPAEIVKKDTWNQKLDVSGDNTLVLFFSQHGGADRKGAYLWLAPTDATSPSESQRLYVGDILAWLGQFPNRPKLLIFDAAQIEASDAQGALHNDFARALKELDARIADMPNLAVICSADEGQRSWFSEEWRQTGFSYHLLEGWKGAAGEKDSRITAKSLFDYVQKTTRDWARANRAALQEPILLPTKEAARAGGIDLASVNYTKYRRGAVSVEQAPGYSFTLPPELQAAWERRDALASGTPSPLAISPHNWRRYQDSLIRAEQLLRYGMPIEPALQQVRLIENELTVAASKNLQSSGSALMMPRALGLAAEPVDPAVLTRLWNAEDGGLKVWTEVKQSSANVTQTRLGVASLLLQALERADRLPDQANLARVAKILANVDLSQPPPSETHLLLLLHRDLQQSRPEPPLIRAALAIRQETERLAIVGHAPENEYPYSDQVVPWFADSIFETDGIRLRGEDLLFSSESGDWTKAAALLAGAQGRIRETSVLTSQLRRTLRWRDRLAAELPYYSKWIAGLQSEFPAEKRDSLVESVEKLAAEMHAFNEAIVRGPQAKLLPTIERLDALQSRVQDLQRVFDEFVGALPDTVLPNNWRQIDNALQVPWIPAARRMQLLHTLRRISRELAKPSTQGDGTVRLDATAVVESAQRQGRMSWALLGEQILDEKAIRSHCGAEVAKYRAADLAEILRKKTATAAELQEVGEQLGAVWRALPLEIDNLHQEAYREAPNEALQLLTRAESMLRLLNSATAIPTGRDPMAYLRRHRQHQFLLFQTRRVLDAGWAAVHPEQSTSYSQATADALLNDAATLLMEEHSNASSADKNRLMSLVSPLRDRIKAMPFDIQADQSTIEMTEDDAKVTAAFRVLPPPNQRFGYPVLRYESMGALQLPGGLVGGRRPVVSFVEGKPPPANEPLNFVLDVDRARAAADGGSVRVELLHRGHRRSAKTEAALAGKPDVVWIYRPPQGPAGIAVRADEKLRSGAIGIVLDTSGSMTVGGKFDQAVQALGEMLRGLPDGTEISIAIFAGEGEKPLRFIRKRVKPDYGKNPRELDKLLKDLGVKPEGRSPIAYAIRQMKEEGFPPNFAGFKTVLMLSDGDDNVAEGATPGDVVQRAFRDSDVVPQIVCFRAKAEEWDNAVLQFGRIRNFDPPGQIWPARDQAELIDRLRDAMLPRIRFRRGENLVPSLHNAQQDGLRISLPGVGADQRDNENWTPPLEIGPYTLRSLSSKPFPLVLERGDRLWLELRLDGTALKLAPARYTDDVTREFPRLRTTAQNVRLAVANCRLRAPRGPDDLEVLAMLERDPNNPDELALVKPRFVWFEMRTQNAPANNPGLMPLTIENVPYYPASTWRVTTPNWPAAGPEEKNVRKNPAKPIVAAWWLDRWPGNANRLPREQNLSIERAFDGKKVTVGETEVTIRSVRMNERDLEIRMSMDPKKAPVFVRVDDLGETAAVELRQEHRFYAKAGQYTARFGPLSDRDEQSSFTLVFHSLPSLKDIGVPLRIDLIDPPTFNRDLIDPLPQPPKLK